MIKILQISGCSTFGIFYNLTAIKSCSNITQACDSYSSAILISLNICSAIINLMHIGLLISTSKRSGYFWILVNLTIADIVAALFFAVRSWCGMYALQLSSGNILGAAILSLGMQTASQVRYFELTLASLDRFYAVCRPFDYSNSRLVNHIGKMSILCWIFNLLFVTVKISITSFDACLSTRGLVSNSARMRYMQMISFVLTALPALATAVLLGKTAKELHRMKQRGNAREDNKEIKTATKYIIGVYIILQYRCSTYYVPSTQGSSER